MIAVLVIDRVSDAVPLAQALLEGGVETMELTLRTPVALECLREIRRHVPEMLAGVGTILSRTRWTLQSQPGPCLELLRGPIPQ